MNSLSSRGESVTPIVDGLRLTINLIVQKDKQWLHMALEDELNMAGVEVDCPILCTTLDRRYHLQEATVVGTRRLFHAAFEQGLISDYPGELMIMWKSPSAQAVPMPTPLEDDSALSSIDLGSL